MASISAFFTRLVSMRNTAGGLLRQMRGACNKPVFALITLFLLAACSQTMHGDFGFRIASAGIEPQNWLSYGRDYQETRDSPLAQIDTADVGRLKLAWSYDLDTNRGQETTPLIVDGRMYTTSAWSKVQAFDAVSGKLLWQFDPQVPGEAGAKSCCDVVNRGAAYWDGKVVFGTLDGRLIALNARDGKAIWSTATIAPGLKNTITGAPRIAKGLVFIGNGGAEEGARGYVSAYNVDNGKLVWRFYTVPGAPGTKDGAASDDILHKLADKTWFGKWYTREGGLGGGTVWDSIVYDPETDLLFVGVGNGGYWNRKVRSDNKGDNLFLSSILALRPETGEYVWHYQETPGDEWDYTATQQIILAQLMLDGKPRKVLMQAPKNGFFYVLDRKTGELLSAKPYAKVNWADGVDMQTGRPNIRAEAHYSITGKPFLAWPSSTGAHNWNPMSYSTRTGMVYIPAQEMANFFAVDDKFKFMQKGLNTGTDQSGFEMPLDPATLAAVKKSIKGSLVAWDPVQQRAVWQVPYTSIPNGGVLSTAGGLVFQGDGEGFLHAYDEKSGKELWRFDAQTPITAPPVTWAVDRRQYVTVVAGWGGSLPLAMGPVALDDHNQPKSTKSRVLTFTLDGTAKLPPRETVASSMMPPPDAYGDAGMVARGAEHYKRTCVVCHGMNAISASAIPDLRYSSAIGNAQAWNAIVRDGVLTAAGMVSFADNYSEKETDELRAYLVSRARETSAKR